jgi:uncharacterized protein with FMN-binding domain
VGLLCAAGALTAQPAPTPDLDGALAALRIPPAWLADVRLDYDTSTPWKQARLHVRKLLDQGNNRQAVAITYDYIVTRKAAPDDHEYALYLYLGGEWAWAVRVYRERLAVRPERETIAYLNLASLYRHYGRQEAQLALLRQGLEHLPKAPWDVPNAARLHERIGDSQADAGDTELALESYAKAMALYPTSRQPWGRETLPKHVSRLQAKCDLLKRGHGRLEGLRNGTYEASSIGYAGDVGVTLEVQGGKVSGLRLTHTEHIDQGATRRLPAQIQARQSLEVDAITAATITTDALVEATYRAARGAGLK